MRDAERSGALVPGGVIVEGSVRRHAGAAPAAVGAGEDLTGARARLPLGGPVLVLVDGRAVALTHR